MKLIRITKNWLKLGAILFASALLASCAVTPPNVEACFKLIDGAACAYTIDGPDRDMSEYEWDEIGRISVSPKDWIEIRRFIEEVCAHDGWCTSAEQVFIKLDTVVEE